MSEIILTIEDIDPVELYGEHEKKLNLLRAAYPEITITSRGNYLKISGEKKKNTQDVKAKLELMVKALKQHKKLSKQDVEEIVNGNNPFENRIKETRNSIILYTRDGKPIRAKTANQQKLVESTETNDIVFAIGPAGTGKTYTAVALAVKA